MWEKRIFDEQWNEAKEHSTKRDGRCGEEGTVSLCLVLLLLSFFLRLSMEASMFHAQAGPLVTGPALSGSSRDPWESFSWVLGKAERRYLIMSGVLTARQ